MFRYGEVVICIDDSILEGVGDDSLDGLQKDNIYHVRWVGLLENEHGKHIMGHDPETFYVKVAEIYRPITHGFECPYFSWRFAPLQETKKETGIEILKKLTRHKKVPENA